MSSPPGVVAVARSAFQRPHAGSAASVGERLPGPSAEVDLVERVDTLDRQRVRRAATSSAVSRARRHGLLNTDASGTSASRFASRPASSAAFIVERDIGSSAQDVADFGVIVA